MQPVLTGLPANTVATLPPESVSASSLSPSPSCTRVLVSFTGGKDSTLALHILRDSFPNASVSGLVTFVPADLDSNPFLAHPVSFIQAQATALCLPHRICVYDGPDYEASYRKHMASFVDTNGNDGGIQYLATGDMEDTGHGFLGRAADGTGLTLFNPLWKCDRHEVLRTMVSTYGISALITCVALTLVPAALARSLVGRVLTLELAERVAHYDHAPPIDVCGENGEFHTMCLDAVGFAQRVRVVEKGTGIDVQDLDDDAVARLQRQHTSPCGKYRYLHIDWDLVECRLCPKS
ncbi:hypothetical protein HDU84_009248 [Entophlyctis sp. JEL0112]|nr:hypothetical protein HDU84_009248 [Entophlyctis sp. JEL0112]